MSNIPVNRPGTKILLDGGDPGETMRIRGLLGFLDGQTTNPTFVAKNPDVQRRTASGRKLSWNEQKNEYKKIVQQISPLVGEAGVSIRAIAFGISQPVESSVLRHRHGTAMDQRRDKDIWLDRDYSIGSS